ncbi:DNA primase (EC 2.7.7.-) [uncultured Gammaproteobacteria bacterium]|jgi:Fic family protein|nr:DNA primase (EC 2.7.7.-) [uncultured Gammaproteobacteria bacterium]SHE21402.1 Huntingtin interacting protein E-like protein [Bathymodiolus brooksi thiotrophic gill symbiont]CAC9597227.1 DNA primase (EC 2.7.7.-) [uncultured Gammaproteobacteria bacterium]CAC9620379.1 DNA primase (EC 2.7.7.-) [uncultured Gammaproteobacteria bacterium]CAC9951983.1 DNA primase (EC 2.7.7.-) [uncultured Gammaproteobacteria bacterium]
MAKKPEIFENIQRLRKRYYASFQNKQSLLDLLSETEVGEQVYNSNAIENSTLTLGDTEKVLLQIDLDKYISERELFEAKNLARVVDYINKKATQSELTLEIILLLHKMLLANINDDFAGRWRQKDEWVRVGNHIAVAPEKIIDKLHKILADYFATNNEHIIKRIALLHLQFEQIHPFIDGNGRIGRVLNNYLLIRDGFVPINIKFIDKADYYTAFSEFNETGKTKVMEQIIGTALSNSYHKRLAYLEGKEIITLADYGKRHKISHANLINKAKRQTIAAFSEKGKWKIGD